MNIIWLQITSLVYMTILLILFFCKKRINSEETKIFKFIMIANEVGLVIELTCFFTVTRIDTIPFINMIATHLLLIYYLLYILLFTVYLFLVGTENEPSNKLKKNTIIFSSVYFFVNVIAIILLPMYYHTENEIYYS